MTTISTKRPNYYVGIGSSAGGLEALQLFLKNIPIDSGAVYIVIQHLSPDYKSMMPEILSKCTDMEIYSATEGVELCADTVYIIPPKKNMVVVDGKLHLFDKDMSVGLNLPIDIFFKSLAKDKIGRSIGIVLSGTGSDGSRGLKFIKEAHGLVIVQDPISAKFDGMPRNAIATDLVDFILSPQFIGARLSTYVENQVNASDKSHGQNGLDTTDTLMQQIFAVLKRLNNIDFNQYKPSTITRRIERRMTLNDMESMQDYLSFIITSTDELEALQKELLIGVTEFFRDGAPFDLLARETIPTIVSDSNPESTIRAWVAACSTGEEAYTIAILLNEELERQNVRRALKVFATDVNATAISIASAGIFSESSIANIQPHLLSKYFDQQSDGNYKVKKELRNMVIFAVHNLIVDPPFSGLNLITCRNLLIYFQHTTQKKVLASLHFAMVKDGYLMLGSSETLGDLLPHFNVIAERERLYQKKTNLKLPLGTSPNVNLKHQTIPQVSELMRNYKSSDNNSSGVVIANEHIISMYAPPCVLLNEDLCVVHVYGDMSLFVKRLPPGRVTNQIKDMVNDDISLAVSSALHKSKASQSLIEYVDMKTASDNDQYVSFNLRASYCSDNLNAKSNGYYWLIFDTQEYQRQDDNLISKSFDMSEQTQQRIEELELELKQSKESLQLTVEELEATNEELQSSNEELMSANEELQSTNEELQSVNEELFTVNSEYQEKISDFYEANTDLDEVLQLSRIGIIFLDTNMCIRRFTSAVTNYLNLLDTDLGRPFHHISLTIPYDDILKDIAEVLALKQMQEKEIILADKRALLVSIIPYMSSEDDVNTGVALTFSDVSALKYSELGVNVAYSTLRKSISNILAELDQTQPPTSIHALIVGKHNSRIKLLKDALMQNASIKFEVMHCDSTSEAKAIANKGKIDICFCDIECEEESIYSFVDSLNDLNRPIPLVAITDKESKSIEAVLISHGVLDMLSIDDVSEQSISKFIHQTIRRHHIDRDALTIN